MFVAFDEVDTKFIENLLKRDMRVGNRLTVLEAVKLCVGGGDKSGNKVDAR